MRGLTGRDKSEERDKTGTAGKRKGGRYDKTTLGASGIQEDLFEVGEEAIR